MNFRVVNSSAALAVVLGAAAPTSAQHSVKSGIEAWQRGNFSAAVAIWRPLAEKGNPDAAFNLGQAYRLGRGVPVDLAQAQRWLEKAARLGHLDAETTLGLLLFDSGNRLAAMQWLKKAAERGEPRAMLVYGTALFNGDGLPKDPVMAYAYVSRAAAQGLEPAKRTLADMDQVLPLAERRKAIGIAMAEAKQAPEPASAAPVHASPPPSKPTPAKRAPANSVAKTVPKPVPTRTVERATTPAPPAHSAPVVSGGWRIQLGAFSQRGSAEALYRKLSGALGGREPYYIPAGKVTRLQVGPYPSRAAASAACASLKGQPCFPVAAK